MQQQQQVFSDRYEMVRHLARGGMAQVYLAKDLLLDRLVALKVLFPELSVDRAFVERFRREAKAAANLSHPNIVSIYDWGQGEHTYFIVMEYVEGETLSSLLREGPLEARRAAAIGADVAAALEYAHRRGVIHRDVKPGNVLIESGSGRVKVADFGIARAIGTGEDLTQTGSVMGTATYFSPEQAQGFPVDARSDVYSLGVVLYEMVAGRAPFTGDSPVSIAYKHVKEQASPPSQVNGVVPAALEAVVMKALAKDPADRYQSAEDLRADLMRFSAGSTVVAAGEPTRVMGGAASMLEADATQPLGRTSDPTMALATGTLPGRGAAVAPPPLPPAPRRRRGVVAMLVALLVLALAAAAFFGGRYLGWWDSSKTLTIPPDVVGKTAPAAEQELHKAGFSDVSTRQQSSTAKIGTVFGTSPPVGSRVKSDRAVVLLVSSGVPVPNVSGDTPSQAVAALQAAGLKVNSTYQSQASSTVAAGLVISTNPPAGKAVAGGTAVTLVVSSGPAPVAVPPLAGDDPITAANALRSLGLNPVEAQEASTTYPAGQVTRTNPPAGSLVSPGSTVTVYVSTGPPGQVTVPDLRGDTQAQAQAALQQAGLVGNFTTQPVNRPKDNGIVISQSPGPNASVPSGSTVNVVIGSYAAATTTTTSTSTTTPSSTIPGSSVSY